MPRLEGNPSVTRSTLFKVLDSDGTSPYQGHPWNLPRWSPSKKAWIPGEWMEPVEILGICSSGCCTSRTGYHVAQGEDVMNWYDNPDSQRLFVVQKHPKARMLDQSRSHQKLILSQCRLTAEITPRGKRHLGGVVMDVLREQFKSDLDRSRMKALIEKLGRVKLDSITTHDDWMDVDDLLDDLRYAWNDDPCESYYYDDNDSLMESLNWDTLIAAVRKCGY